MMVETKKKVMMLRPIYYDTETTGTKAGKDAIIELAAYDPENKKEYCTLINPRMPIPQEATMIHNITDDMVKEAPTFDKVIDGFIEFCGKDFALVAHNNDNFDRPFLEAEFGKIDRELEKWIYIDSLKWSRKYRPDLPRHSLQYLREVYEIPANQAHRALDDVMVLYRVFSQMIDDLPLETIIELLYKPEGQVMPFGKYQGTPLTDVPKSYILWLRQQGAFDKHENRILKEQFEKLGFFTKAAT